MSSFLEPTWLKPDNNEVGDEGLVLLSQDYETKSCNATAYSVDDGSILGSSESLASVSVDEDALREMWADVLDLDPEEITSESHFFELGGDSLAAGELAVLATQRGMSLSRTLIFRAPTFADMVTLISSADASPTTESVEYAPFGLVDGDVVLARQSAAEQCGVRLDDIEDLYPTTALQAGLMASSLAQPGTYVSTWTFKAQQLLDPMWLCRILKRTVEKLPILRTALTTSTEHAFVQVVLCKPAVVNVVRVPSLQNLNPQSRKPEMSVGTPLTKIEIIIPEDGDNTLVLWHGHHAAHDMVALNLIAGHISDIASGSEVLLSLPSFASFVAHSLDVRRNPEWKNFWSKQLEGCPAPFFPHSVENASFKTNERHIRPLLHLNPRFAFTVANVVRGAWAYLLSCYENADDVVFGVTNGGRYAPVSQCARIVGPTIATTPMRVRLSRCDTIADFLQQISVQAVDVNSFEQVGLPLIQQLGPDAHRAVGFRTLLNVQTSDASRSSQLLVPADAGQADPLDYALVLELFPRDGDVTPLSLSYDNTILGHDQVVQVSAQLEQVMRFLMNNPEKTLNDIAGISPEESRDAVEKAGPTAESIRPFSLVSAPAHQIKKHAAVECGVLEDAIEDVYPCTSAQAGLMKVSLQHPTANISRAVFAVRDDLADAVVSGGWNTLYRRAPILRTRFFQARRTTPGFPSYNETQLQLLQAVIDEDLEWREGRNLQEYLAVDRQLPFGLGQALTRFALIRDGSSGKVKFVVMTAHQAVCDRSWSRAMLQVLDGATSTTGVDDDLAAYPYNSFLSHMLQPSQEESNAFWVQALRDCLTPPFPELPVGHEPLTTASARREIALPAAALSSRDQFMASTVLLSAWAIMLTQYYDSNDVVFGVGVSGRPAGITEGSPILGPTLSNVPLRIAIKNQDASIADVLQLVQQQHLAATAHAQNGFRDIQNNGDDSCAAACRFQNVFVVHDSPDSEASDDSRPAFQQIDASPTHDTRAAPADVIHNFGLVVEASLVKNTVQVSMSFDPSVLEPVQVRRLLSHYEHVLLQLCASESAQTCQIGSINHVPDAHWAELLSWAEGVPPPVHRTVHGLFEDMIAARPDAPAICARDGEWTYSQLDDISERLARRLVLLGVGPGTYVPLLFEKRGLAIIVMLAILKAGAASVALDPSHPPERLRNLIGGMGDCMVLCSGENRELGFAMGSRVLVIDDHVLKDLSELPHQPRLGREKPVSPESTAFVLFTSGSTGMPKGILIPHQSFASSIRGHSKVLRFSTGPGSRNFQFTAYTSDVSIGEIFTSLAVGSCVCVPSDWDRKNNLAGSMRDMGVNWAFFTPSVATLLTPSEVPALRTLVFGGETATPENFQTWSQSLYLINSFGPAECSIWTNCIPRPVTLDDFGSNIGYGVGCATWITDPTDYNRLLPIGSVGEMLVEGPNLASGYLNEPVKTSQAFVSNPAWMSAAGRTSMRLYRTGDLARYLPNGMVQFLGRRDHQIKLRGLRIELGEIEHQIRTRLPDDMLVAVDVVNPHPAGSAQILASFIAPKESVASTNVDSAVVSKPNDDAAITPPEKQKALSLLLTENSDRFVSALRGLEGALRDALPTYMVPSAFVPLREMPLTVSAKTDRKALKLLTSMVTAEELGRLGAVTRSRQAPRTVMEHCIARLWSAALGRSLELSVQDSFFRVGGDSLSAMRLVSFARKEGVVLSVEQVFKYPILHDMAELALLEDNEGREEEREKQSHGADAGSGLLRGDVAEFALLDGDEARATASKSASEQLGVDEDSIEDIYHCTPLQEGLLALSQDAHGSYVARSVYELPPNIDLPQFESAWASVVASWPILRTRFFQWHDAGGASRMMQAVVKSKTRWSRSRGLHQYLKLDQRDRMQVGDRMLRLAAFRDTADQKTYFVMTLHHAVYDGWMVGLLFAAIRRAYLGLEKLKIAPFNAFVNHLVGRDHERSQKFWQGYIGDASRPSWPELPSLDFRPKSSSVTKRTSALPPNWQQNFTPTALVRSAFGILLGAYGATDDVVFASTVYGRALGRGSAEMVAGPTLATVPVRIRIGDRERKLHELLAGVQADGSDMLAHEQEGMQSIKRFNREALAKIDAQSLLVVQIDQPSHNIIDQQPIQDDKAAELALKPVSLSGLDNGFLSIALVLEATVSGDEVRLLATFDDRVLSQRQTERFLQQMSHILYQLCNASANQTVADLELIPQEDLEEILSWNAVVPAPTRWLVHELFAARAREQPDVEALVSWEGSLTYQQLDDISSRLAAHLWTSCGLRAGIRVALLFEKSLFAVVAMLAVLKIGAANVALNPSHPPDRLRSLIDDVDAEFILCSETYQGLAQDISPGGFFRVGPSILIGDVLQGENGARNITPDDVSFLLFTSGSTGKPKAIMIDHVAFCSSINGHGEILCYRQGSRNLQFTAYTSDVSIGEMFTSLSRGATVCIPSDHERMNDLAGAMERMRVDWAFLTPSVASLLDPNHVPTLKTLLFGGESATVTNVKTWASRLHLINSFGPAETSIWSHAHPHFKENDDGTDIGWSVGCATWIVDPSDSNKLMPIGAIGELLVEGPNVAAGYYKNPEKTEAAFPKGLPWIPSGRESNRIYRMGDLARWLPDGRVQFLGRKDGQVKLHGQRIEVGEVEHNIRIALGDNGAEVAVEMIKDPNDATDSRLMAFINCTPANEPQDRDHTAIVTDEADLKRFQTLTADLREKLAKQLASHMVPSFIVPLSSMPLNASAKTDRKLLCALVSELGSSQLASFSLSSSQEIRPPQSPMEKLLHTMWCSVLGLAPSDFGTEADFFKCGGDSIAAMKIGSLARAANASLSVQDMYEYPQLGDLARAIEERAYRPVTGPTEIPALSLLPSSLHARVEALVAQAADNCSVAPDEVVDIYPCTPTQRSLIARTLTCPNAYWLHNVFEIPAQMDTARLEKAWEQVVAAHAILRSRVFTTDDGMLLQAVLRSADAIQHADTPSIQEILGADRAHGLIYGQPLLRSTLVNEVGGQRYLVLTLHHSIYDAWSLTRLFSLLESAYERLATPPEKTKDTAGAYSEVGFNRFVKSIMEQDQAMALDFWAKFLKGVDTKPLVPPEKKCKANTILRHKMMLSRTPESGTTGNNRTGAPPRVTHAVMTYAAVALALHNQRQAQDTVLRLVSTGRITAAMPDIEDLVGPTVTSVPLRIQHSAGNLHEYLAHVQAQVRRVMPFEQTGFDEASGVHAEAERACRGAPQIIVHPHDPYTEQPAAGLGLRRRELSALNDDDSIPFTMDISLQVQGKTLEALDLRVVFDSNLIPEHDVRRLVAELEVIISRISSAISSSGGNPAALTDIIPAEEDSVMIMDLERQMAVAQNES